MIFFVQVFGISWIDDCAYYFVGYLFQCPGYPARADIYDAPSVCLGEYIGLLANLKNGQKAIDAKSVATGNYSEYCVTECYQTFVNATVAYNAAGCPPALGNLSAISAPMNAFRGIACGNDRYFIFSS